MSRRSPKPEERQRDAERTRTALLDAARREFAAKGRAGARVNAIAERAGVNKQLISYYFGGKDGLYQAVVEDWLAMERSFHTPGVSLEELVSRYLRSGLDGQRLFIRENLDADDRDVAYEPHAPQIEELRRRQAEGELGEDLDPAFILLALQGAVISRVVFPDDVKRLLGLDPTSPEYLEHAEEQLRRIVRRLAGPGPDGPSTTPT